MGAKVEITLVLMKKSKSAPRVEGHDSDSEGGEGSRSELVGLLLRTPPPDHDFTTCPICKKHGITEL